ncbi:amino acid-binding protein [Natronosporangium hydrolyticum]|uniref:Amino acid-binding protein n=1 Tax=Natronosporangium hydrolyticum TaxID=2811111 RepID=A0A895YKF6_9ACTN|nr:amino acid-binding protein [Natronosporangium hydrolyticum]QSB16475.1 amino acid-binding protein [Natronosporangium hydrolyticum]
MLLRVRVTLPDRPGALGQVARTLGVSGADIVQVVVLERLGGRAVDDFTVVWPQAARVERLLAGLGAVPGVRVDGLWSVSGAPMAGGHDAQLLAQLASNPTDGVATLVDAVPGLLAADWAAAVAVPPDWADRYRTAGSVVLRASWQAAEPLPIPEVSPLRSRALAGPGGVRYAVAPFERAGMVLVAARAYGDHLPPASFHRSEVDRLAQLVRAAAVVLGDHLDAVQLEAAGLDPVPAAPPALSR